VCILSPVNPVTRNCRKIQHVSRTIITQQDSTKRLASASAKACLHGLPAHSRLSLSMTSKCWSMGGLKAKPQCTKKMVIADHGCTGYPALVSMSNSQDSEEASTFKVQAQQRHKKDNDKLKTFWCLDDRFSSDTNAAVAIFDF